MLIQSQNSIKEGSSQRDIKDVLYMKLIARADEFFGYNDYGKAEILYDKAILFRPREEYPVEMLSKIDKNLKN